MSLTELRNAVELELTERILPFHIQHIVDAERGGFYGSISNNLSVDYDAPKGAVQCARLLWTYARAYRLFADDDYLIMAKRAFTYLLDCFWDAEYGGLFWSVTPTGEPHDTRKLTYAQAFGIYGLSEFFRATQEYAALTKAIRLFHLLESRQFTQGYVEGTLRNWEIDPTSAVDTVSMPVAMSMNTHLHILEAYANLLLAWPDSVVRTRLHRLIVIMNERVYDAKTGHLQLHFDADWRSLSGHFSYGHDIEASWLMWESAEILNDPDLCATIRPTVLRLAEVTLAEGIDSDGGVLDEGDASGIISREKHWWPQAEALVGFLNAYQMTGDARYVGVIGRIWTFIQSHIIDPEHGEWIWGIDAAGDPLPKEKAGMWKTPYHNGRACFELLERLSKIR